MVWIAVPNRPSRRAAHGLLPLFGLLVGVSGCAVAPEDCDPAMVRNVGTSLACQVSGVNEDRLAALRAEVQRTVREYELTVSETQRLQQEASVLAADQAQWQSRRNALQRDLDDLTFQLQGAQATNPDDQARLDALSTELSQTQDVFVSGSVRASTKDEIENLTLEVERRRQAIAAYLAALELEE